MTNEDLKLAAAGSAGARLQAGLVGYFSFDGTLAQYQHPGSLATVTGCGFVSAWDSRKALGFLGQATAIFPALSVPAPVGGALTYGWSGWINVTALQNVFIYTDNSGFTLALNLDGSLTYSFTGFANQTSNANTVVTQTWTHIALTVSGIVSNQASLTLWVNGVQAGAISEIYPSTAPTPFQVHTLGGLANGLSVCDVGMFQLALDQDLALYLACDRFRPDARHASEIEYLALTPDGSAAPGFTAPDSAFFNLGTGGVTVTAWLYTPELEQDDGVNIVLLDRPGGYSVGITSDGCLTATLVTDKGDVTAVSTGQIDDFDWAHLAVAFSPTAISLFINGDLAGSQPVTGTPAILNGTGQVSIGESLSNPLYSVALFTGALDAAGVEGDMYRLPPNDGSQVDGTPHGTQVDGTPHDGATAHGNSPHRRPPHGRPTAARTALDGRSFAVFGHAALILGLPLATPCARSGGQEREPAPRSACQARQRDPRGARDAGSDVEPQLAPRAEERRAPRGARRF